LSEMKLCLCRKAGGREEGIAVLQLSSVPRLRCSLEGVGIWWDVSWCQDMRGYVFRLNCLSHLHERGLAAMKAVKFRPQKALCQERSESGHRSPAVPPGSEEKAAMGGNCTLAAKKKIFACILSSSLAARSELVPFRGQAAVPGPM